MSRLAHVIRFLVGVSMVAGGATLAAPLVLRLSSVVATTPAERPFGDMGGTRGIGVGQVREGGVASPQAMMAQVHESMVPQQMPTGAMPAAPFVAQPGVESSDTVGIAPLAPLQPGYQPPTPPEPLPPQPLEFVQPGPELGGAYRSTLNVPPPQLLDAQRPPPLAVAWTVQEAARPVSEPAVAHTSAVPSTYRVRDGDDLAGIATRFYGQPAAAAAIWAANRAVIVDPNLLTIGVELRLPPPWTVGVGQASSAAGPAIEPVGAPMPSSLRGETAGPSAAVHPWLAPAAGPPAAAPMIQPGPGHATMPVPDRMPRTVRVGAGDSLVTIAQRMYGDPGMAGRIWEANRGRLRSPELLVPGMELTLP